MSRVTSLCELWHLDALPCYAVISESLLAIPKLPCDAYTCTLSHSAEPMSYEIRPLTTTWVRTRALPFVGLTAQGLLQFLHLQTREVRCAPHTHSYNMMALPVCQPDVLRLIAAPWGSLRNWTRGLGQEMSRTLRSTSIQGTCLRKGRGKGGTFRKPSLRRKGRREGSRR